MIRYYTSRYMAAAAPLGTPASSVASSVQSLPALASVAWYGLPNAAALALAQDTSMVGRCCSALAIPGWSVDISIWGQHLERITENGNCRIMYPSQHPCCCS